VIFGSPTDRYSQLSRSKTKYAARQCRQAWNNKKGKQWSTCNSSGVIAHSTKLSTAWREFYVSKEGELDPHIQEGESKVAVSTSKFKQLKQSKRVVSQLPAWLF